MRRTAANALMAAVTLAVLLAADRRWQSGSVLADGLWDHAFFRGFSDADPEGFRVGGLDSELILSGLGANGQTDVELTVASAQSRAQVLTVFANGVRVTQQDVGGRFGQVHLTARADADGVLRLRIVGDDPPGAVRVRGFQARFSGGVPWRRVGEYLALALLGLAIATSAGAGVIGRAVVLAALLTGTVLLIASERLVALGYLPWALGGLAAAWTAMILSRRLLGMTLSAANWIALALGFRTLMALHPAFPAVDIGFHAHTLARFQSGEVVTSHVASPSGEGMLAVPYPPLLYAALSPMAASEASATRALRLTMLLLEGTAPWLVFALMRAGGASLQASQAGAVTASVMPEGLLVLAKGIAANILGSWLSLLVLVALLREAPVLFPAGLFALAFLAHPGSAAALVGLVIVCVIGRARRERTLTSPARALLGGLAGGLIAWLLYYRRVWAVTLGSFGSLGEQMGPGGAFFAIRIVHLGKIAQNLLLKLGGAPLLLVPSGLAREDLPRLSALLRAWLLVAVALAVLAIVTPVALRFEYFVAPAVAAATGLGAERWQGSPRRAWVPALWTVTFVVQCVIGLLLLLGRFELISVIIPSPRWAFPARLW